MRFVLPRKLGTGSGLPNATAGFKPLMLVMMATQKLACIHRKKHVCNSPCYVTDAYILLSQMDHSDALSFSPVSELFTLFVWYNLFPWDCTCSIKSRKKPFSRATNITHTNSHTHTRTHSLWGLEMHLGKHFSHKFFIPLPIFYSPQNMHSHTKVLALGFHFVSFQLQIM